MGNNRFNALLSKYKQHTHSSVNLSVYWGKRIAVDGTNILYVTFSNAHRACVRKGELLVDPERRFHKWIEIFLQFVGELLDNFILPVFIFDGEPPEYKMKTREDRKKKRKEATDELEKMRQKIKNGNKSVVEAYYKKYKSSFEFLPAAGYEFFPRLLASMGIPAIIAKHEAEPLCVYLQKRGRVDAVLSNDIDNIAYGCTNLIMHKEKGGKLWTTTNVKKICKALELTYEQMLIVYILCGCDYNTGVTGTKQGGQKLKDVYKDADRKVIKKLEKAHDIKFDFCHRQFTNLSIKELTRDPLYEEQLCYNKNCYENIDEILLGLVTEQQHHKFKVILENFMDNTDSSSDMVSDVFVAKKYDLKGYLKTASQVAPETEADPDSLENFL